MVSYIVMSENIEKLVVYTDGGSRNNPGHAAIGYVIFDNTGTELERYNQYIGIATNNEAEYQALLTAVRDISTKYPHCEEIELNLDSELVVKQLTGVYKIKESRLKTLANSIHQYLSLIPRFSLKHILREKNKIADSLVNQALDERK